MFTCCYAEVPAAAETVFVVRIPYVSAWRGSTPSSTPQRPCIRARASGVRRGQHAVAIIRRRRSRLRRRIWLSASHPSRHGASTRVAPRFFRARSRAAARHRAKVSSCRSSLGSPGWPGRAGGFRPGRGGGLGRRVRARPGRGALGPGWPGCREPRTERSISPPRPA